MSYHINLKTMNIAILILKAMNYLIEQKIVIIVLFTYSNLIIPFLSLEVDLIYTVGNVRFSGL